MLGRSPAPGTRIVDAPEDAEVIVVNTCGFIGAAKEESIDTILEMARHKARGQRQAPGRHRLPDPALPDELADEMPEVDHFLGSDEVDKIGDALVGRAERVSVLRDAALTSTTTDAAPARRPRGTRPT